MLDFFHPSEPFSGQTQRLVARAQYGAADIFEIAEFADKVVVGDVASWNKTWADLGNKAETEAIEAESKGHTATAIARYFHASTYWQMSDVFSAGAADRSGPFIKSQDTFRRGARLHEPEIRVVSVKYGDEVYDGYYCLPAGLKPGQKVPGVLFIGGADAFTEETYFSGKGVLDRGMAMLLLDLPGRGSSLYLKGIPTRYDYEKPSAAAFDWLEAQPEIDPKRLGLLGISFGGYYAPRVAAFEPRVKALVAWGGMMNVTEDIWDFHPRSHKMMQFLTGTTDDAAALNVLEPFNLTDVAPKITCPTMIIHGAKDGISSVAGAEKLYALVGSKDKQLHVFKGPGAVHCNYDDWRHAVPLMFDWMRKKLG